MIFVIDFDGTLATEDTVDQLLEHHADAAWRELEADWLEGRISALECMQEQVRLVRADHITLGKFFRQIRLDPHFAAFRRHVGPFAHLAVVSDGLDFAIHTALRHADIEALPVFANQLQFISPDRLELSFPHRHAECGGGNGVCKCAIARQLAARHGGPVVLIGDGKSDACLAGLADVVFAKDSLVRHCQGRGIAYTPFENFADVLRTVQAWDLEEPLSATL
ncbi:MAG: 2,3-diketo-5-methylthio-phosphopentane phosphatase [Rhodocyclaceae bacterium]|nr:2,3-diketo-5-methylthio-phosphopentane phosphatase [Rhodocyclaceae bacterium]